MSDDDRTEAPIALFIELMNHNREITKTILELQAEQERNGLTLLWLVMENKEVQRLHRSR
jgi:hypothetical protein